jgi:DNA helicase-2/ATP-dependent DNA helicase PcrA
MCFARRRTLHGGRGYNLPSRFLSEIPEQYVDRRTSTSPTGWPGGGLGGMGTGAPERRQPHATPLDFAVGDDVVHASFGEGVVTGIESGNLLVVRFAGDATERKLMADYAPLRKAG